MNLGGMFITGSVMNSVLASDYNSFHAFYREISEKAGIDVPFSVSDIGDVFIAERFLTEFEHYLFQAMKGTCDHTIYGERINSFSDFRNFWEAHHREIINARIDREQARLAAQALNNAIVSYSPGLLKVIHYTQGLSPQAIAQVRFFTANQDFSEPPENPFGRYLDDPSQFDADVIADSPAEFLNFLGMTRLSQTDKRLDFAKNAAAFLISNGITAFEIAQHFSNNAVQLREALVNAPNMGYGLKKANMFIRDMVELGVWPNLSTFDRVDVASDINTMKLALRTGILKTDIPLISSFLDIFCYQYGYIDEMSAQAWRVVWEEWNRSHPETAPSSPCQMDFLLYRIGREYCDENVVSYECWDGHLFFYFGARLQYCRICKQSGRKTLAQGSARVLPCQIDSEKLPRENGVLLLSDNNLLRTFDGICIFEGTCKPRSSDFKALNPPKSISIKGQTGWTNSYAYRDKGGGGMMG